MQTPYAPGSAGTTPETRESHKHAAFLARWRIIMGHAHRDQVSGLVTASSVVCTSQPGRPSLPSITPLPRLTSLTGTGLIGVSSSRGCLGPLLDLTTSLLL